MNIKSELPSGNEHPAIRRPVSVIGAWCFLSLLTLAVPSTSRAQGLLTNGGTHEGSITPAGDTDTWTFTANAGDSIVLRAGEVTDTGGTQGFTPGLRLYSPNGTLLDMDVSNLNAVEVKATATATGTFTAVVSDGGFYTNGTGTYRLHLAKVPGTIEVSPGDEGGPLTNGATQQGTIHLGDLDMWTFSANAGDSIVLRAGEVTETSGTQGFTPALRLYGPNGALLDSDASNLNVVEVTTTATTSGSFTVVVGDGGNYLDGTGSYRLHLAKVPGTIEVSPGDEGGPLTNGATHQGTIHLGDLDMWTFSANAGDSIVLRAGEVTDTGGTQGFTPALRLYGPNGALLKDNDSNLNVVEVTTTATASGTFTVVVSDGGNYLDGTGSYRLHLAKVPGTIEVSPGDEGGPLTNGATHQGTIHLGDLDMWTFPANAGDSIVLRAGEVSDTGGTQGFTPALRLYGPNGALLDSSAVNANAVEVSATTITGGTFTVVVGDGGNYIDGTGVYVMSLVKTPGTLFISPGDDGTPLTNKVVYTGTITTGDLDAWTFTACDGDGLRLQVDELAGGTSFSPSIRLYAPNGALLNNVSGATTALINRTAPMLGTYTLIVSDGTSGLAGAGTYQLTALGVSTGLVLCDPIVNPPNVVLRAAGGPVNGAYVLTTTTNITTPANLWTPFWTNQFSALGEFRITQPFDFTVRNRYFRLLAP